MSSRRSLSMPNPSDKPVTAQERVAAALEALNRTSPPNRSVRGNNAAIWEALEEKLPEFWYLIREKRVTRRMIHAQLKESGISVSYASFTTWLANHPPKKN